MGWLDPQPLILWLHTWPGEGLDLLILALGYAGALLGLRLFGLMGLAVYVTVAVLAANLQVLKVGTYMLLPQPVALGTALFASTYAAMDLATEHYGARAARRIVWLSFSAYALWTLLALVLLGYRPLDPATASPDLAFGAQAHGHLAALLTPAPSLFAAGMISYIVSQLADVWVFQRLRRATDGRLLWLRGAGSTALSALIDSIVFSLLAWIVFSPDPLPLGVVVSTYIIGTYMQRLVYALLAVPLLYLARATMKRPVPAPL